MDQTMTQTCNKILPIKKRFFFLNLAVFFAVKVQVNEGIASHMVWPDVFMEVGWKTIHGRHNWNFKASKTDFEL